MRSMAIEVGCRPPWDIVSPSSLPMCNLEELGIYNDLEYHIWCSEKKTVINRTGCLTPCTFREYKVVGEPQKVPSPGPRG